VPRPQADEGLKPYEIRTGVAVPRLKGMNRHDDPAGMPANAHHLLVNVRLDGGEIIDRSGSTEEEDTGSAYCITGMIEIDDVGVGLWIFQGSLQADPTWIGNFNEQASPDITYHIYADGTEFISCLKNQIWANSVAWETLVRFRKKILAAGERSAPLESDEGTNTLRKCLFELDLSTEEGKEASRRLLLDLNIDNTTDPLTVRSMVTRLTRETDAQTGESFLQEELLIGTSEGKIFRYDGTSLVEELDLGDDYSLRLVTHNGIGVFAIGSTGTAAVARYQSAPGGSWATVTLPDADLHVTDLFSWGGKVFVTDNEVGGGFTRGPRIYAYTGGASLGAHVFEFPWTSSLDGYRYAGTFFEYRGSLNVLAVESTGLGPILEWYIWRRDSDSSWTDRFPGSPIEQWSDYESEVNWLIVTGGRVIFGGDHADKGHAIQEVSMAYGNTTILHQAAAEDSEQISTQALVHSPDDTSLDQEEV
jgi:hypothetical protein